MTGRSSALWIPIAHEITHRVVGGLYQPGSLIPTEAQLSDEFGVSRTVIREGIKILAEKGLIRIVRGTGTVVLDKSEWRPFDPEVLTARLQYGDRETMLREVLILRKAIEPELAAGAAQLADEQTLARLKGIVEELTAADADHARYLASDSAFHEYIAEMSQISLGREIMKAIGRPLQVQRDLTSRIPGNPDAAHAQHLEIYREISNKDVDGARLAMRHHLEWAEERLHSVLASTPA